MLKGYIVAMSRKKTHVPDKALLWKFFFEAVNTFGIDHNVPLILKLRTNDHRWDHLHKIPEQHVSLESRNEVRSFLCENHFPSVKQIK